MPRGTFSRSISIPTSKLKKNWIRIDPHTITRLKAGKKITQFTVIEHVHDPHDKILEFIFIGKTMGNVFVVKHYKYSTIGLSRNYRGYFLSNPEEKVKKLLTMI